ncbi:MAG: periplasmic heavy metal sensor [Betaproteobacteria bacterium]
MKRTLNLLLAALALCGVAVLSWAAGTSHGHDNDPLAVIAELQAQLKLNTSQQLQFDNALAQSKTARDAMRSGFAQLKSVTQAELAKPAPDLASLAALSDQVQQQSSGPRKQARAAWLALYDTLSADQKLTVRDAITARIASAEAMHAQMRAARGH